MTHLKRWLNHRSASALLLASCFPSGYAQGTVADYERASSLGQRTANQVFRHRVRPFWLSDGGRFWYRNDLPRGEREFIVVDADGGKRDLAFDHDRLAGALTYVLGRAVTARRLPVENLGIDAKGESVSFTVDRQRWRCDLTRYSLEETAGAASDEMRLPARTRPRPSRRTGEETHIVLVNETLGEVRLFWIDADGNRRGYGTLRSGARREQHTFAGHVWLATDLEENVLAVFEAAAGGGEAIIDGKTEPESEEPPRARRRRGAGASPDGKWRAFVKDQNVHLREVASGKEHALSDDGRAGDAYESRFYWSPDSDRLAVMRRERADKRQIHFVESSPKDQLQPKLHTFEYVKPGDSIDRVRPCLFDVPGSRQIVIENALFENPWSIDELRWAPGGGEFTFLYNQRGHQVLRLVGVDARTGRARAVIDEQSQTFLDYAGKKFTHYLDDTAEVLWMSERDGWNHLYLYDAKEGRVKQQITRGPWAVRRVEHVDAERRQIWFFAGGIRPEQDPYYLHFCRVGFDGQGLTVLTEGDGTHRVEFSPDRRYFLDTWSRVDLPPVTELRRSTNGGLVCELERADWTGLLAAGWRPPARFVAKGRDGRTDIHGVIYRPVRIDPGRRYPVIEEIYAGPHSAHVPKAFGVRARQQGLAELGFVVVQIDGMGTSHRSKAFHDVCWRNLGDAGFPDRIRWMQAAAREYPCMDLDRVGIYGGSAGGQNALRGLLAHGDFYDVGVADCGCHDNRMDKIWWNELWMGWPIGPHYAEQSNVTQAHWLQGKLLLIVGELDRNVDPASTLQVVNALIQADKDFELLLMTGTGHGAAETPYASRRRMDFFVRHLLGVEPRAE